MLQSNDQEIMLELIQSPAFFVVDNTIVQSNKSALAAGFEPGINIQDTFVCGPQELSQGVLCASIQLHGNLWNAVVYPLEDMHVFRLDQNVVSPELRALSLMGTELRYPIGNLSMMIGQLFDCASNEPLTSQVNKELHKVLRVLNNVSNALRFSEERTGYQEEYNICSVLSELLDECGTILEKAGIRLHSVLPKTDIYTMLDWQMFRQAVYNLLNNAAKHSAPGSTVEVSLTRRENKLQLCVTDNGPGIPLDTLGNLFSHYTRDISIAEGKSGLGLGMAIVRIAANAHGGTVLVDTPPTGGTRVTMTMSIRHSTHLKLHSTIDHIITAPDDGLIMFSNILPSDAYAPSDK